MRNSAAIEDDFTPHRGASSAAQPERRKTIMGRKLRVMTVEKGLLRETKVVQKMINALVECRVCPFLILTSLVLTSTHSSIWTIWMIN